MYEQMYSGEHCPPDHAGDEEVYRACAQNRALKLVKQVWTYGTNVSDPINFQITYFAKT